MSLISRKKAHRPFIDATEVARRIGCINAATVRTRRGITKDLTRYPIGRKIGYDQDEVEQLAQSIREQAEKEKARLERFFEPFKRHMAGEPYRRPLRRVR